jgi:hypothetical protein
VIVFGNIDSTNCFSVLSNTKNPAGLLQRGSCYSVVAECERARLRVFFCDLFAGFLVDDFHRQANLAAIIKAEELDPDFIAFLDDV